MATLETVNIFKERSNCTHDNVLHCPSVFRIEAIQKSFNAIAIGSPKEALKVSVQSIQDIFRKNEYEYAHLYWMIFIISDIIIMSMIMVTHFINCT
eukprot:346237_1